MRFALLSLSLAVSPALAKETRETFNAVYDVRESDNFALKWQAALHDVDDTQAEALIAGFERSYARLHGDLGYALPRCADSARVNAYVSSAAGTPAIESYGGLMSIDVDGCAFLILSHDMITSGDPGTQLVVTHEYFHAVQFGTEAFSAPPTGAIDPRGWYFEATANWAVTQVYPEDDVVFGDLRGYLAGTEHSIFLTIFDVDERSPVFAHEYGAFLFATFIEAFHGGPDVIRDSWRDAGANDDPLLVLADKTGLAPGELFVEFAAHNAAWDYPPATRAKIDAWLPILDVPVIHARLAEPVLGFVVDRPLHAFGYHVVELAIDANAPPLALRIVADDTGDRGTPSSLRLMLVRDAAYEPVDLAATVPVDETVRFLVVASDADTRDPFETFHYALSLEDISAPPAKDVDEPSGCASSTDTSALALLVLALLVGLRPLLPNVRHSDGPASFSTRSRPQRASLRRRA